MFEILLIYCARRQRDVRYEHYIKTRVAPHVGKQHIIELNGKRYDAVTGKMIAASPVAQPPVKTSRSKPASLDGFAKTTNPAAPHKTEKSKTLMRKTVARPEPPQANTHAKTAHHIQASSSTVSAHKQARAATVPKSNLIRRFNDMVAAPNSSPSADPEKSRQNSRLQAVVTATTVASSSLADGIARASSHEQPKAKRARLHNRAAKRLKISPRILSAGSLVLAGILIGGFFAYQNIPNLTMRLASARAGVNGTLPGYQPAGFSLRGGISYKPGQITIGYKANSDGRNFTITESNSSWNSETLVQNFVALKDASSSQTIPNKGKTIYIYNGSNATWVDGGIWYRVEGDSQLNSDQILNIANSM